MFTSLVRSICGTVVIFVFAASVSFFSKDVLAITTGNTTGSSVSGSATKSANGGCGNCNGTYNGGSSNTKTTGYQDNDNSGTLSNGDSVSQGEGGGGNGGNGSPGNTPQPVVYACKLVLDPPVIEVGSSSVPIKLSWTPQPADEMTLWRGVWSWSSYKIGEREPKKLSVPKRATTTLDSIVPAKEEKITYELSFKNAVATSTGSKSVTSFGSWGAQVSGDFKCTAVLKIVDTLTECNDGVDNGDSEDSLIDEQDPGCHTDGDPTDVDKPTSYDPKKTTETNVPPNLVSSLAISATGWTGSSDVFEAGRTLYVRATTTNVSRIYAPASIRTLGWRRIGEPIVCSAKDQLKESVVSGWFAFLGPQINGKCFKSGAQTYTSFASTFDDFSPLRARTLRDDWRPQEGGDYEICAVADVGNKIIETNEQDNRACRTITVTSPVSVDVNVRKTDGDGVWRDSLSITAEDEVELEWVPEGNVVSCASTNNSHFRLPTSSSVNKMRGIVSEVLEPTEGSRTYAVQCRDASGRTGTGYATVTVGSEATALTEPTLTIAPLRVRRNEKATLTWNTGGHPECTISTGNQAFLTSISEQGSSLTETILAEKTFTLTCADGASAPPVTVKVLPAYQEI